MTISSVLTYLLTYARHSRWNIGHARPLVITRCYGHSRPVSPLLFQLCFSVKPLTVVGSASLTVPLWVPGQGLVCSAWCWLPEGVSDPTPQLVVYIHDNIDHWKRNPGAKTMNWVSCYHLVSGVEWVQSPVWLDLTGNSKEHTPVSRSLLVDASPTGHQSLFVGCLLNVPATCECISGTDLLGQFYVLPLLS